MIELLATVKPASVNELFESVRKQNLDAPNVRLSPNVQVPPVMLRRPMAFPLVVKVPVPEIANIAAVEEKALKVGV